MSNYSYGAPPPPPPPPPGSAAPGSAPWYRQPGPLFLLGLLIAAAVAIPILLFVVGGDEDGTAASTSTTGPGPTSTTAGSTTTATMGSTTTAATTTSSSSTTSTTAGSTTTTAGSTTTSTTTIPVLLELDYTSPAIYGEDVDLAGGFAPDPIEVIMEAGGPVDASTLNEIGCWGWASVAPSYEVNWTAGSSPLLRFYFVADSPGDDTVIIVSDPYGNWVCNDDYDFGAGIYDPAVDFAPPPDGTYDIWVASYNQGETISGTLYVTESEANHP